MPFKQLQIVFTKPKYIFLAVVITVVIFTLAIWLPNFSLIGIMLLSDFASVYEKLKFILSLYESIFTNFSTLSASYTIMIAVLFGIQSALLMFYIRKVRSGIRGVSGTSAAGIGGLISGMFGIGCASCGTFILTSALSLFGATGFLSFLPFRGEEFGVLGVILLSYSIFLLLKKIQGPLVCSAD
jgi:hypothetical protein